MSEVPPINPFDMHPQEPERRSTAVLMTGAMVVLAVVLWALLLDLHWPFERAPARDLAAQRLVEPSGRAPVLTVSATVRPP